MKQIKSLFVQFIPVLALVVFSAELAAEAADKKVLMLVSGYGQQPSSEQGQEQPGYEFSEFAKAYLVFNQHGISVDIASPKGGQVQADEYDANKVYNAQVLADKAIMAKLENTLSTASLKASSYDGVFVVGGKGAMFDLPKDSALQQLIADIYQQGGSIAAVCHGPAALVDVKLDNGSYLLADKAVNGFTNEEEQLFGKKWLPHFEFMLEDKLVERGGQFQSSPIMLSHVAVDGRLITGQNPSSTVAVAIELVKSMGIEPTHIESYQDDRTLELVAQLLDGDADAAQVLISNPEQYHLPLVGMYGFYYLKTAATEQDYQDALKLMSIGQKAINNPKLDMQIAKTQHKLGDKHAAANTLNQLLAATPDFKPALEMLESLSL